MAPPTKKTPAPRPPVSPCPPDRYTEPGMVVQWFPAAGALERAVPALVVRVGLETIDCHAIHESSSGLFPYSGVHHYDYQSERVDNEGAWKPLARDVALLTMLIDMGLMVWDGQSRYVPKPPLPTPELKPPTT